MSKARASGHDNAPRDYEEWDLASAEGAWAIFMMASMIGTFAVAVALEYLLGVRSPEPEGL